MIRYFCDRCETEIPSGSSDHGRMKIRDGRFLIEIMTGVDGTMNKGLICHTCIRVLIHVHPEPGGKETGR